MLAKSCRTADQYWRPSEIEETTRKVALAGQKRRKRQRAGGHQRWPQSCRSAFIRSLTTHAGDQSLSDTRDTPDRSILPLAEPQYPAITEVDARKATPPPRFELKPPKGAGAPNVVFILMDNFGFGDPGCFGGPVNMPAFERLAKEGLRYKQHAHRAGLLANAGGPAHRPQLAQRKHGRRSRNGHGLSRHELRASPVRRTAGRNPAAQWLRDGDVRQIP
jgi:hypothetical protein